MNIIIERATVSDAEEILLLQRLAYRSEADIYDDDRIEPLVQTLEQLQEQFENHVILKTVIHETIIGSIRASDHDGTCYIGKLFVHPNYQNKGIGAMLMNAIEGVFQNSRYELFTGSKSTKNIALYEKLGYTIFRQHLITPDVILVYLAKEQADVER
jgi:ribosomal protein S18 acetylase RimI-like enzyme